MNGTKEKFGGNSWPPYKWKKPSGATNY